MLTDTDDFRVKKTVGSSWKVDEDDVVKTKTALERTGDYKAPAWGVTGFPDDDMFDGLKSFQKREGLAVDGVMKPGGPTEKRLGQKTKPQPPSMSPKPESRTSREQGVKRVNKLHQLPALGEVVDPADWSDIDLPVVTDEGRMPEIGRELPGGRKRGPDGKEKRPGETQIAIAPLIPAIAAGGAMAARYGPRAWQNILRNVPPLIGAAEITRREADRQGIGYDDFPSPVPAPPEDRASDSNRANMDRADPPPPTPGLEPPDEKLPDRTESPAEPVELADLSGSLPESEEPAIFVLPTPEPGEFGDGILERKGNEATRKELERVRDYFEKKLGWKHLRGGRYSSRHKDVLQGKKKAGDELKEFHIPGHFGSLKGGRFSDLKFEVGEGRYVHVQTVDVDKNGKPTQKELDAAESIRRATGDTVLLIPKGAQLDRLR